MKVDPRPKDTRDDNCAQLWGGEKPEIPPSKGDPVSPGGDLGAIGDDGGDDRAPRGWAHQVASYGLSKVMRPEIKDGETASLSGRRC